MDGGRTDRWDDRASDALAYEPVSTPRAEAQVGDRVGEYVLEARVGLGGFGPVWRARHAALPDKHAAIKLPLEPEIVDLLRRESILRHGLDHPGVFQVLGMDLDGPVPYIVQDFAEGGDLASHLARQSRLSPDRAVSIFREIVAVVAAAHENGVVHRDLKPGNILLDSDGRVRVADFGLGRGLAVLTIAALRKRIATLHGFVQRRLKGGAWEYMSPEQRDAALGTVSPGASASRRVSERAEDPRVDIWALGIMLYELIEGRRPTGRVDLEHVSSSIDAIFSRCWTRFESRYTDARELLAEVEALGQKSSSKARSASANESTISASVVSSEREVSSRRERTTYSAGRAFWQRVLMLIPILVVASVFFVVFLNDTSNAPTPIDAAAADMPLAPAEDKLVEDEAMRLGQIRRTIEDHPLDTGGAVSALNSFISEADNDLLQEKALHWREALEQTTERRDFRVRLRGFAIHRDSYKRQFHSRLEPGAPDIYVRVYQTIDGDEELVFNSSETIVESWTHTWKNSGEGDAPSFEISWKQGDGIRVEMRESDMLRDNTVCEYRADSGYSIFLLSSPRTSSEGHRIQFEADFSFGK